MIIWYEEIGVKSCSMEKWGGYKYKSESMESNG